MKRIDLFFLLGLLFVSSFGLAQNNSLTDYKIYKEKHQTLSCQIMDSALFEKSLKELLALDTKQFSENLDLYHRDLAQAYISVWMYSAQEQDIRKATAALQSIKDLKWGDLYNLAYNFIQLNECEQGLRYLNRYLVETPKEYWMPHMDIWFLQNACMQLASNDYNLYRKTQLEWESPQQDSLSTIIKLTQLQLLDTTYFTQNMDTYYHDLGLVYLQCFAYFENTILLQKSNVAYLKQKELSKADLWNVILNYYKLGECEQASFYLKKYKQISPGKIEKSQKQQLVIAKKGCG